MTTDTLLDRLSSDLPDISPYDLSGLDRKGSDREFIFPQHLGTPRSQLRRLLQNMVNHCEPQWDGWNLAEATAQVFSGEESLPSVCQRTGFTPTQIHAFPTLGFTFPRLIANEIVGVQPLVRPDDKVFFQQELLQKGGIAAQAISSKAVCARPMSLMCSWTNDWDTVGPDALLTALNQVSHEIALEHNLSILSDLFAVGRSVQRLVGGVDDVLSALYSEGLFDPIKKPVTHLILGLDVAHDWIETSQGGRLREGRDGFPGLELIGNQWDSHLIKLFKTAFWQKEKGRRVLAIHRGKHWCDVPSVWAPYVFTVTHTLHALGQKINVEQQRFNLHSTHNIVNQDSLAVLHL